MRSRIIMLLAVLACSGTTSPDATLPGTWTLHTVNGFGLPYETVFQVSTAGPGTTSRRFQVLGGTLVVRANGTWTEQLTSTVIAASGDSIGVQADSGTYRLQSGRIYFDKYEPPVSEFDERQATLSGDKMLLPTFPFFLVYRKQ